MKTNGRTTFLDVATKESKATIKRERYEIPPLNQAVIQIEIVGDSPLIQHAWSAKATRQMLETQMQDPKTQTKKKVREPKNPFEDFVGSLHALPGVKLPLNKVLKPWESWHYMPNTFGVPCAAFGKSARSIMVECGIKGNSKNVIKVLGEYAVLTYKRLVMREDLVRIGNWPNFKPDLRYRGMFEDWGTIITVKYDADYTSPVQVINLFNRAGAYSGVLEWRGNAPKNPGDFGSYHVKGEKA